MAPPPLASIDGITARAMRNGPLRLTAIWRSKSSTLDSCVMPKRSTPATLARMRVGPNSSSTSATAFATLSGSLIRPVRRRPGLWRRRCRPRSVGAVGQVEAADGGAVGAEAQRRCPADADAAPVTSAGVHRWVLRSWACDSVSVRGGGLNLTRETRTCSRSLEVAGPTCCDTRASPDGR